MKDTGERSKRAQEVAERLEWFVQPLLAQLDAQLDKRLVRTFLLSLLAILVWRHSRYGLLLSELGGSLAGARACRNQAAEQPAVQPEMELSSAPQLSVAASRKAAPSVADSRRDSLRHLG